MTQAAVVASERSLPSEAEPRARFRSDIQALRAVAVLGVVLFHLWPGAVRGGYVGVDIFFVVSGFLITSHLAREVQQTGTVRLGRFWARRVRRLLPAALVVLAVTALATFLVVPQNFWAQHFRDILASTLYIENWTLAADSVDYLAAENSASSAQHYWSLSVEEQFYIIWPLLLLLALWIAGRAGRSPERVLRVALLIVGATSLAASVYLTATDPAPAYFVTYTRAWEFAAGGLLALSPLAARPPSGVARPILRAVGWILVIGTTIAYTSDLPFPGWIALGPVVGAVAVIAAGPSRAGALDDLIVAAPPVQFLGKISYSLYLWHWPLVVLAPFLVAWVEPWLGIILLIVGILLATATQRWIEDPVRFHPVLTRSSARSFIFAATGMAIVVALAGSGAVVAQRASEQSAAQAEELSSSEESCFGADAFLGHKTPCDNPSLDGVLLPEPAARLEDTANAYSCYLTRPGDAPEVCTVGSSEPTTRLALVGDSHAAMLVPALEPLLEQRGWSIDIYVANGGTLAAPSGGDRDSYRRALIDEVVSGDYDLVLTTARRAPKIAQDEENPSEPLMTSAIREVVASGTRVAALRDNPYLTEAADACISAAQSLAAAEKCQMTEAEAFALSDPLPAAIKAVGDGATLIDMTDAYCADDRCPLVVGNVIVYRDRHHITATFARTLGPFLAEEIGQVIDEGGAAD